MTPTDEQVAEAKKIVGHEGCPHWMDDDHCCAGCAKVKPVALILAARDSKRDEVEAGLRSQIAKDSRGGALQALMYQAEAERAETAEALVAELRKERDRWHGLAQEGYSQGRSHMADLVVSSVTERSTLKNEVEFQSKRAEKAEAALAAAKEFGAGCNHHNLGAIIRGLRAELAALKAQLDGSKP